MSERIWDFTTIDTFQTCRKKYYFRMVRHLTPIEVATPLLFGSAIHDALDAYYTDGLDKALEIFGATYQDHEGDELRTVANGVKLLNNYAVVYAHEPFKVLGRPEVGFVFQLGDILWGGRMDLPVEWDGDLYVMEHKTTTRLEYNYSKQFDLDKQITSYVLGAEEFLKRKCLGCIINVLEPWKELKRPTVKSKKPADHFFRDPIPRTPLLKERFKLNVQRIVRDILWCEENKEFYEAEKKEVCRYYNKDCPFKQLCMFGEDERVIARDYKVEKWEPYKEATNGKGKGTSVHGCVSQQVRHDKVEKGIHGVKDDRGSEVSDT